VPVVRTDGGDAGQDLVAHLCALGHRRLAIIAGPAATTTGSERVESFRDALPEHALPLPDDHIGQGDFQAASGRRATARFLDLSTPPDVTLGAAGALVADPAGNVRIPSLPVKAVDTTGAGDAFTGALAWRLGAGDDLETAVRFAVRVGAAAVTKAGAQESFPTVEEVAAL
jgi:hypothetical protein